MKIIKKEFNRSTKRTAKLPLSIKALAFNGSRSAKVNFDDFDALANTVTRDAVQMNYTKIRKVEYLEGYEIYDGLVLLNQPIWEEVDGEVLDNLETGFICCRLQPYSNDFYDIVDEEDFKDYNSMFIIKGEEDA